MMKHLWMRCLTLALALLLVLPLGLTACNEDDPAVTPPEPKTAEGVLRDAAEKLGDKLTKLSSATTGKDTSAFPKDGFASLELSADLSSLLEMMTGEKTSALLAIKSFAPGVLQIFEDIGGEENDLTMFFAGQDVILTSEKLFGGKAYSFAAYEPAMWLGRLLDSIIQIGGDEAVGDCDFYYYGIGDEGEDIWLVFDGEMGRRYPMDTYVVCDSGSGNVLYRIEDAAEVVPYEPTDVFENYEFVDGLDYAFGDDAMYGFDPLTAEASYPYDQYAVFYGNDGESYVVFPLDSYVRMVGDDVRRVGLEYYRKSDIYEVGTYLGVHLFHINSAVASYSLNEYMQAYTSDEGSYGFFRPEDAEKIISADDYSPLALRAKYCAFVGNEVYVFDKASAVEIYDTKEYPTAPLSGDPTTVVVFNLHTALVDGDSPEESGSTVFSQLLPMLVMQMQDGGSDLDLKAEAEKLGALAEVIVSAAKTSFASNHTLTLAEKQPLTVHNRELTTDNVTLRITEAQLLNILSDVLDAVKNSEEASVLEEMFSLSLILGQDWTERFAQMLTEEKANADENNFIDVVISADAETGMPVKVALRISYASEEDEDAAPRTVSFDALTVELIDGYVGVTLNDEKEPLCGITTTWDTDAERTMAQTFFYLPMENDKGETVLGEQFMIDWLFCADKTYSVSIVTDDLSMISFDGSYDFSETAEMIEIATVSVTDGEMQLKLPLHLKLKLNATDEAPTAPEHYEPAGDDVRELLDFFFPTVIMD